MNNSVMLFSGGLDSVCMQHLLKPDTLLYVDMETPVCTQERRYISTRNDINVTVVHMPEIRVYELANRILPARNAMFVLLAAQYGTTIILGATSGDSTKDKDHLFADKMTNLLLHMMEEGKCPTGLNPTKYNVSLPFRHIAKSDIITMYLEKGGSTKNLIDSYSCYNGDALECGVCRSCLRKFVALYVNEINTRYKYANDPVDKLPNLMEYSLNVGRSATELANINTVLDMVGK